eukprot:TRINITY_DN9825_c0_g1_i1.p1 TRINITY_DN9825_c0_g1~~TRINITY_DN9825_c0_g1_i1.p1  ORF type:complete len:1044 (-),score=188.48 TRINITY_DN9825_c0_g1_i1:5-3136(-)
MEDIVDERIPIVKEFSDFGQVPVLIRNFGECEKEKALLDIIYTFFEHENVLMISNDVKLKNISYNTSESKKLRINFKHQMINPSEWDLRMCFRPIRFLMGICIVKCAEDLEAVNILFSKFIKENEHLQAGSCILVTFCPDEVNLNVGCDIKNLFVIPTLDSDKMPVIYPKLQELTKILVNIILNDVDQRITNLHPEEGNIQTQITVAKLYMMVGNFVMARSLLDRVISRKEDLNPVFLAETEEALLAIFCLELNEQRLSVTFDDLLYIVKNAKKTFKSYIKNIEILAIDLLLRTCRVLIKFGNSINTKTTVNESDYLRPEKFSQILFEEIFGTNVTHVNLNFLVLYLLDLAVDYSQNVESGVCISTLHEAGSICMLFPKPLVRRSCFYNLRAAKHSTEVWRSSHALSLLEKTLLDGWGAHINLGIDGDAFDENLLRKGSTTMPWIGTMKTILDLCIQNSQRVSVSGNVTLGNPRKTLSILGLSYYYIQMHAEDDKERCVLFHKLVSRCNHKPFYSLLPLAWYLRNHQLDSAFEITQFVTDIGVKNDGIWHDGGKASIDANATEGCVIAGVPAFVDVCLVNWLNEEMLLNDIKLWIENSDDCTVIPVNGIILDGKMKATGRTMVKLTYIPHLNENKTIVIRGVELKTWGVTIRYPVTVDNGATVVYPFQINGCTMEGIKLKVLPRYPQLRCLPANTTLSLHHGEICDITIQLTNESINEVNKLYIDHIVPFASKEKVDSTLVSCNLLKVGSNVVTLDYKEIGTPNALDKGTRWEIFAANNKKRIMNAGETILITFKLHVKSKANIGDVPAVVDLNILSACDENDNFCRKTSIRYTIDIIKEETLHLEHCEDRNNCRLYWIHNKIGFLAEITDNCGFPQLISNQESLLIAVNLDTTILKWSVPNLYRRGEYSLSETKSLVQNQYKNRNPIIVVDPEISGSVNQTYDLKLSVRTFQHFNHEELEEQKFSFEVFVDNSSATTEGFIIMGSNKLILDDNNMKNEFQLLFISVGNHLLTLNLKLKIGDQLIKASKKVKVNVVGEAKALV